MDKQKNSTGFGGGGAAPALARHLAEAKTRKSAAQPVQKSSESAPRKAGTFGGGGAAPAVVRHLSESRRAR